MDLSDRGRRSPTDRDDFVNEMTERNRSHSTASLLDSMERRTQRTYRYGIGLVCIGATLNWLGFAQGHGYVDPLRYLGVACVISGSFCVCMAMCRWLGRPISVSSHRFQEDERSRQNGDVHVINVAVPMYSPPMHEEYRPCKPPDYDIVTGGGLHGEPPPYDEAIKLSPGALCQQASPSQTHHGSYIPSTHLLRSTADPSAPTNEPTTAHLQTESTGLQQPKPAFTPPPPYDVQKVQARAEAAMMIATCSTSAVTPEPGPCSRVPKNLLFRPVTSTQSQSTGTSPTQETVRPINLLTASQSLSNFTALNSSSNTNILFSGHAPLHHEMV